MIDPGRLIENKRIRQACSDFRSENPWAFEYDPREEFHQIKIWTNPEEEATREEVKSSEESARFPRKPVNQNLKEAEKV